MDGYWFRALEQAEAAERRAKALRETFGSEAEAHCSDAVGPSEDAPAPRPDDVRKALRWT